MTTNLGTLVLKLEADITELQRRIDEAERSARQSGRQMGVSIKDGILLGIGSHRGTSIDLNQPRTQITIKQNIKSIKFKRVGPVSGHELNHSF